MMDDYGESDLMVEMSMMRPRTSISPDIASFMTVAESNRRRRRGRREAFAAFNEPNNWGTDISLSDIEKDAINSSPVSGIPQGLQPHKSVGVGAVSEEPSPKTPIADVLEENVPLQSEEASDGAQEPLAIRLEVRVAEEFPPREPKAVDVEGFFVLPIKPEIDEESETLGVKVDVAEEERPSNSPETVKLDDPSPVKSIVNLAEEEPKEPPSKKHKMVDAELEETSVVKSDAEEESKMMYLEYPSPNLPNLSVANDQMRASITPSKADLAESTPALDTAPTYSKTSSEFVPYVPPGPSGSAAAEEEDPGEISSDSLRNKGKDFLKNGYQFQGKAYKVDTLMELEGKLSRPETEELTDLLAEANDHVFEKMNSLSEELSRLQKDIRRRERDMEIERLEEDITNYRYRFAESYVRHHDLVAEREEEERQNVGTFPTPDKSQPD